PHSACAYFLRGEAHFEGEDDDQALRDFTQAVQLDPEGGWPLCYRARVYRRQGKHQQALSDLSEAIKLDRWNAFPYKERGLTRIEAGDPDGPMADLGEAIRLNRALGLDRDLIEAYRWRGQAYLLAGKPGRAATDLTRVVEAGEADAAVYTERAQALAAKGRADEALADAEEALRREPENSVGYFARGLARWRRKEHEAAIADYT